MGLVAVDTGALVVHTATAAAAVLLQMLLERGLGLAARLRVVGVHLWMGWATRNVGVHLGRVKTSGTVSGLHLLLELIVLSPGLDLSVGQGGLGLSLDLGVVGLHVLLELGATGLVGGEWTLPALDLMELGVALHLWELGGVCLNFREDMGGVCLNLREVMGSATLHLGLVRLHVRMEHVSAHIMVLPVAQLVNFVLVRVVKVLGRGHLLDPDHGLALVHGWDGTRVARWGLHHISVGVRGRVLSR